MTDVQFVSLIHLLQHPDKYDQKKVRVVGLAALGFERRAIYISEEAYRNAITKNAVWLRFEMSEETKKLHEKFILVEGIFDAQLLGHLKLYSGTIRDIERLELWSDPSIARGPGE